MTTQQVSDTLRRLKPHVKRGRTQIQAMQSMSIRVPWDQANITIRAYPFADQLQPKVFEEKMIDLPDNDPSQWHNVTCGKHTHRLVVRMMDPKKRTLEVVSLSRVLGPAMMVRDPVGVQSQVDSCIYQYYELAHHMGGSTYHGGASDHAYHHFKGK